MSERDWLIEGESVCRQPCFPKAGEKLGSCCLLTSPLCSFSKGSGPCCPAQPFKTKFSVAVEKHPCPVADWEAVCFQSVPVLDRWKNPSRDGLPGQWGQEAVLEPCSWPVVSARWVQPFPARPLPASWTKQLLLRLRAGAPRLGWEVASPSGFPELYPQKLTQLPPFIDEETEA